MRQLVPIVAALPLFRLCERRDIELFVDRCRLRTFSPGATVLRSGERSEEILLLLDGALQAEVDGVGFPVRPGDVLGEAALFTDDMPALFTVTAQASGRALVFELPPRRGEDPVGAAIERAMLASMSRRIRHANSKVKKAWKDAEAPAEPTPAEPPASGGLADRIRGLFGR